MPPSQPTKLQPAEMTAIMNTHTKRVTQSFVDQPWSAIGFGSGIIASTNIKEKMIDQLCLILEERLNNVIVSRHECGRHDVALSSSARKELRQYVSRIAYLYNEIPYHNFEHACHVTISMNKLLNMIFEEDLDDFEQDHFYDAAFRFCNGNQHPNDYSPVPSKTLTSYSSTTSRRSSFEKIPSHRSSVSWADIPDIIDLIEDGFGDDDDDDDGDNVEQTSFDGGSSNSSSTVKVDAVTKFAAVFSALVHDVDHRGVPNVQLVKEGHSLAKKFKNKSIAEFHSLKLSLNILMESEFSELRKIIMPTPEDKLKFRKTVNETLVCTDIADPEQLRVMKSSWHEAFGPSSPEEQLWSPSPEGKCKRRNSLCGPVSSHQEYTNNVVPYHDALPLPMPTLNRRRSGDVGRRDSSGSKSGYNGYDTRCKRSMNIGGHIDFYQRNYGIREENRFKTTVILQTVMNAADVAHTMQSWDNFLKWNEKLYREYLAAYRNGRGGDPSINWFKGQISFFDFYVLPLTRRLSRCGDSGCVSFERNAQDNKRKWMERGEKITLDLIERSR